MKLAFLFLTRDNHNQGNVWEAFFKSQSMSHYSVYCHAKHPEKISQAFLRDNIIPVRIETEHADISVVRATLLLLKYALEDPENGYLILLSDSCIPIYGFNQVHGKLARNGRSFLSFEQNTGNPETAMRWSQLLDPSFIAASRFAKQHQWMALRRELAAQILKDDFTHLFERMYAPDEHYFINLLIRLNLPLGNLIENQMITFVNWRDFETEMLTRRDPMKGNIILRRIRPKTYEQLAAADIVVARRMGCLFFRKVSATCNCSSLIRLIQVMGSV